MWKLLDALDRLKKRERDREREARKGPPRPPLLPSDGRRWIGYHAKGATAFERTCWMENLHDEEGWLLIFHLPDGRTRRVRIVREGGRQVAADGDERGTYVRTRDAKTIISIGGDAFRF